MNQTIKEMDNELLRTKARFMCLLSVLREAKNSDLTGRVRVDWNHRDERLIEWVRDEILADATLRNSTGFLFLKDGVIVGAKIGEAKQSDFDSSESGAAFCRQPR